MYYLYFDGACKKNPSTIASIGYLIKDNNGKIIYNNYRKLEGLSTNNFSEYSALYEGLLAANELNIKDIIVRGDSNLVIQQMLGNWKIKSENLIELFTKCNVIKNKFNKINFEWIPRNENSEADYLANLALK
jgi:ribonuclease HI